MTPRRLLILVTTATAVMALTGCVPEPAPTPTPTGFASEEEAFAAAEETYRAYVDALNARNSGEEDADPKDYLIGEALDAELDVEARKAELGLSIVGQTVVTSFTPQASRLIEDAVSVTALACLDSSDSQVVDKEGNEVTPDDQLTRYGLALEFASAGGTLAIASSEIDSDASCPS